MIQGCPTLKGHPGKCGKKQFRKENTTEMLAWGSRLIRSDRFVIAARKGGV